MHICQILKFAKNYLISEKKFQMSGKIKNFRQEISLAILGLYENCIRGENFLVKNKIFWTSEIRIFIGTNCNY